jgi:hypothetical protein
MSNQRSIAKQSSWGRREFIAAAAGAVGVAYLPFRSAAPVPAVGASERQDLLADWSIDDQWGVYPRYDAIPSTPALAEVDAQLAGVHPADWQFVA